MKILATVLALGIVLISSTPERIVDDTQPPLSSPIAPAEPTAPSGVPVDYFILPHPDDEYMLWSQVEERPDTYKVFILLTQGSMTGYCAPGLPGYNPGTGEIKPSPVPTNKNTPSCRSARLNSWVGFFSQMSKSDPTIPGNFVASTKYLPGKPAQMPTNIAQVWRDTQGRGVLIAFDAGDGHLDRQEAEWAIRSVLLNPEMFGIPEASYERMVGAYYNPTDTSCAIYSHTDHGVVDSVLKNSDFGVDEQMGATCRNNPDSSVSDSVSTQNIDAAWKMNGILRVGAFVRHYGWLAPYRPDNSPAQSQIFHSQQHFWVR